MDCSKISNVISAADWVMERAIDHFEVRDFGVRRIKAMKLGRLEEEIADQARLWAIYQAGKSAWCKALLEKEFARFAHTKVYKVYMGYEQPNLGVYYFTGVEL